MTTFKLLKSYIDEFCTKLCIQTFNPYRLKVVSEFQCGTLYIHLVTFFLLFFFQSTEIISAVLEGYPKTKKQLLVS